MTSGKNRQRQIIQREKQWPQCLWQKEHFDVNHYPIISLRQRKSKSQHILAPESTSASKFEQKAGSGYHNKVESSIIPFEEKGLSNRSNVVFASKNEGTTGDEHPLKPEGAAIGTAEQQAGNNEATCLQIHLSGYDEVYDNESPFKKKEYKSHLCAQIYESNCELFECPQCCGEIVSKKQLRTHLRESCVCRLVNCPWTGCASKILFKHISSHLRQECKVEKEKKRLCQKKDERETNRFNNDENVHRCLAKENKSVERDQMAARSLERLNALEECHLMKKHDDWKQSYEFELPHDPLRDIWAEKSRQRRKQLVACPDCGKEMAKPQLGQHYCPGKRVPCRNREFGCAVMVCERDRHLHENVEDLLRSRSALQLSGDSGFIALNGDDISPPWTAEFWILRASANTASQVSSHEGSPFAAIHHAEVKTYILSSQYST